HRVRVAVDFQAPETQQARMRLRPFSPDLVALISTSDAFRVLNATTGSVNASSEKSFSISVNPQPARRSEPLKVNLTLDGYAGVDLALYDLAGKKILSKERAYFSAGNSTVPFELNSLAAGSYILEARRDDGVVRTMKVVVE
ncbi:MAG: T9SS type A sorting domain-containing protein, partial [Bacteroidota bacterium]|nr:T9SS type A sorting domain-containing protein [Bacteroidota bacterium]